MREKNSFEFNLIVDSPNKVDLPAERHIASADELAIVPMDPEDPRTFVSCLCD